MLIAEAYSYTDATPTVALTAGPTNINVTAPQNTAAHSHQIYYDDVNKFTHVGYRGDTDNEAVVIALRLTNGTDFAAARPYGLSGETDLTSNEFCGGSNQRKFVCDLHGNR